MIMMMTMRSIAEPELHTAVRALQPTPTCRRYAVRRRWSAASARKQNIRDVRAAASDARSSAARSWQFTVRQRRSRAASTAGGCGRVWRRRSARPGRARSCSASAA
eukprot:TRINITY_DN3512_c0_g1_i1.p4 TRINITY_DN3512_c0_g1~~TRINITY_DN3512_c0_g1_i1.p4  ORF type:complete len:106 (-),score=2.52 TRINITY_DN3512_c0_g1_i1:389-706(-)